jgi:hypothetical protein
MYQSHIIFTTYGLQWRTFDYVKRALRIDPDRGYLTRRTTFKVITLLGELNRELALEPMEGIFDTDSRTIPATSPSEASLDTILTFSTLLVNSGGHFANEQEAKRKASEASDMSSPAKRAKTQTPPAAPAAAHVSRFAEKVRIPTLQPILHLLTCTIACSH